MQLRLQVKWIGQALAALVGTGCGLGVARLLYEFDPQRLWRFGGFWLSVGLAIAGALALWAAIRNATRGENYGCLIPGLLSWLYVFTGPMHVDPLRGLLVMAGGMALTLALWLSDRALPRWVGPALIGAMALAAYLLTLQRTVGRADTFEFQVTAPVLGVVHPTGYPLYILIGKLFSLLPLGKVATRVNLTSAVAAASAAVLLYLTLSRILRARPAIAGIAALAFAFGPTLWSQAVVAEVYALHNAFAAALLGGALLLVTMDEESQQTAGQDKSRIVIGLFAVSGLALTHHLTAVLVLPALGAAILLGWPRLSWRQWGLAAGALCAGLLVTLYIPIRWPALNEGRLMPFNDFLAWITGSRFGGALQLRAWLSDPARWGIVGRILLDQYGWPGAILSLLGLGVLARRHWQAALVTGLAFAAQGFYGLNYLVPDIDVFLIPMSLIMALWMGYGIEAGIRFVEESRRARYILPLQPVVLTLFALIPLGLAWAVGPGFDWSDEQALEEWGRYVLSLPLEEGSVILADSEKIAPLEYLHRIEGLRPDMQMVVLGTEEEYYGYLIGALDAGKTIYLQRYLPGLEGAYHLRSVGPLVEVRTRPQTGPPRTYGSSQEWKNGISLLGFQMNGNEFPAGETVHLMLYWTANDILTDNYQVRLRLRWRDEPDRIAWESAPAYPVDNRYPTVAWKPPEIIPDYHAITLPYTLQPGRYAVEVALAPPFAEEIAPRANGAEWTTVEYIGVNNPTSPPRLPGRRLAILVGDRALVSALIPEQIPAGGQASYTLGWQDEDGMTLEAGSLSAGEGTWVSNLDAASHIAFDAAAGRFSIEGANMRCGWMRPITEICEIARIRIAGEAVEQAIANFESKMLLTAVDFEAGRFNPSDVVSVTLHWQALNAMSEDYTVFIHLLGPDGRVHGQVDQWPVQGTFATSRWKPGEVIEDSYNVPLDADAPPGTYRLEIGVYLLSTNTRLAVLDADGNPVDDKILLDGLLVPEPQ